MLSKANKQKEAIDSFLLTNENYIKKYKEDNKKLPASLVSDYSRRPSTAPGILGVTTGIEELSTIGNILNKLKNYNTEHPESKIIVSEEIQEVINRTIIKHQEALSVSKNGKGSFLLYTGDTDLINEQHTKLLGRSKKKQSKSESKNKGSKKKQSKSESGNEGSAENSPETSDDGFEYSDTEPPKKKADVEKFNEDLRAQVNATRKAESSTASGEKLFGKYDDDNGDTISIYSNNSDDIYSINEKTGKKIKLDPKDFTKKDGTYNYKGKQLTNLFYTPTRIVQSLGDLIEEILGPSEQAQAVEPAQLTTANNEAILIAEGEPEVGATTPLEDYVGLIIQEYVRLGIPYGAIETHALSKLTRQQLITELELLQKKVINEQTNNKAPEPVIAPMISTTLPTLDTSGNILEETVLLKDLVEEVIVPGPEQGPPQNPLLQETKALEQAALNDRLELGQAQGPAGPSDPSGNMTIAGENINVPQTDNPKENIGIVRPFIERIHKYALKLLFESDVYPKWDPTMEKNVLSSELSEEERIKRMDIIIDNYGPAISVMSRVGSSIEELVELEELKACVQRNLHLGPRMYQTVSVDADQFNKIRDLAIGIDTNQQTQTAVQQEINASAIEQQLAGGGTEAGTVQSEKEYKFNKAYDKYQEIYARGVTSAPIKKYEPTKVIITETPITIAGQNNTVANGAPIKKIDIKTISNFDTSNINYW